MFLLFWAILLPTYPQLASKMPSCWPSCLQDGSKLFPRPQLEPNLAQLGSSWAHLGLLLQAKMNISCGRCCIFVINSEICVLRRRRWLQDGPDMPQDGSKTAPRAPRRPQDDPKRSQARPKTAPRQPQDSSKTAPSRFHSGSFPMVFLMFLLLWAILLPTYPQLASKMPSCWPSCLQDGFKLLLRPPAAAL